MDKDYNEIDPIAICPMCKKSLQPVRIEFNNHTGFMFACFQKGCMNDFYNRGGK